MAEVGSIWLRPERGSRGPISGLSRDDIAQASITVADHDGLPAVTMRSIATALQTAPASLYRVVASRGQLLELMTDRVFGEFDYSSSISGMGTDGLLQLGHQARAIYRRHPWLLLVPTGSPAMGPNALTYLDRSLSTLAASTLTSSRKLEAVGIASGFVKLLAATELQAQNRLSSEWQQSMAAYMSQRVSATSHPYLATALSSTDATDASDPFDRVLRQVLIGLVEDARQS
jgi:AcrR family transcriptional regulator